ncbi:hypothetical protein AGMMS49942_12990 [Spirochaetia bacterium]|nr:hypothetical protein AGMMS49942_12990 [Spirochaetia bacterium]
MRNVWKLLCLLGVFAVVAVMVFAYTVLSHAPPTAVLRPLMTVCVVLAVGWVAKSTSPAFTKRFTTATGFG